ncbi:MAG: hypothetical protein P8Z80_16925 [Pseudolabrys sp.]
MISEEDYAAAADAPPELAFVRLERKFREILERNLEHADSNREHDSSIIEYKNHTFATAEALGVDFLAAYYVPDLESDRVTQNCEIVRKVIDAFAVNVQISHVRNASAHTVQLDDDEKKRLRAYINKIKEIIEGSSLVTAKKERLFDKLNSFLSELDRTRTVLQRFNDVILSLANTGGEAANEMEPAWKWAKLAAGVLGVRQETEMTKQLPTPVKKLEERPKRQLPSPSKKSGHGGSDLDDEIPF